MPPKRKITKPEANTDVIEEIPDKAPVSKKAAKPVLEASSRTLRPRAKAVTAEPAKPKVKTAKKPSKKEGNDVDAAAKSKKGGKKNAKQTDEEPAEKLSKLDVIEEEPYNKDLNAAVDATSIYDFTATNINGELLSLDKYKDHVCIIVNVASKCGHTASNYKELVEIYDKYSDDKGLRILAFPCNQFGKQEPANNEKICEFAKKRNVNFDMFEKIEVNGKGAHPLWKYLTSQKQGPKGNKIDWNFTKFLINKEGQVVERFTPTVKPSAMVKELEKLW